MYRKLIQLTSSILLTIVIALMLGCSAQNKTQSNPKSESTSSNHSSQKNNSILPSPKHSYKIAETISIMDKNLSLQFTVNGTREHPGKGVIKPNRGHKWILVNTTIANKGKELRKFSVISFALMDRHNNTYDVALLAGALEDVESTTGDISPGEQRRGEVPFEVPKNATGLKLLFKPNSSICDASANEPKVLAGINCEPILVKLD